MRIALVVERFEPLGGGVERVAWNLAQQLLELGDEVHVIARRGTPEPGVTLHWVHTPSFWQPIRVLAFARGSAARVRALGADITHGFAQLPGCDVFHAGGGSHADYMTRAYSRWGRAARRATPRHFVLLALQRRIFADPRTLLECGSGLARDEIATRFGVAAERLAVVHPGVDTLRFRPASESERRSTRAEFAVGDDTVWLFAGSGWHRKGLDIAIEALAQSGDAHAKLWVAGKDAPSAWRNLARRLGVAHRVHFLGPRSDLERLYGAADALVFPTRYDGFGLVCLEAAASGLPIVTSERAGACQLVREAAIVVDEAEEPRAFARALDRVQAEKLRPKLGDAGRRIAEHTTWAAYATSLRKHYASIVARRASQA